MSRSRLSFRAAAAVLAGGLIVAVPAAAADPDPDASINYRKAVMSSIGDNMKAIAMMVKGQIPADQKMAYHAQAMALASLSAPEAFRPNTDGKGTEKTTAKTEVWDNWDEFESKLKDLTEAAYGMLALAAAGKSDSYGDQLQKLGGVCKGCHDDFRNK